MFEVKMGSNYAVHFINGMADNHTMELDNTIEDRASRHR